MISILCPTRRRGTQFTQMVASARLTAKNHPLEVVAYVDEDVRGEADTYRELLNVKCVVGPRTVLTDCWNRCLPLVTGDIVMQGNDDVIFRTPGWDQMVEAAFAACEDKILLVHGDDLGFGRERAGAHCFVHRRWVEVVGYFIAPHFSSDFGDVWLNDVANALGRRRFVNFVVEHMHPDLGKAPVDETTRERKARHARDDVAGLYQRLAPRRAEDVAKLRAVIQGRHGPGHRDRERWTIMVLTQPSRKEFLARLLRGLKPQVAQAAGAVTLDVRLFDPRLTLGENREWQRRAARGEYLSFVDDDDLVPDDFVKKILPLLDGVDQVGFRVQCYIDGEPFSRTYHSLRYPGWSSDQAGHYRDLSHVTPLRRELALRVPMEGGTGEDARWVDELRKLKIVKTEHYIDEVMYHYYYRTSKKDMYVAPWQRQGAHREANVVCPNCGASCAVVFSNGRRCNQCGHQWQEAAA